jgi:hypothetical protein
MNGDTIIDDAYIAKIDAENAARMKQALDTKQAQEDNERSEHRKDTATIRVEIANFVRECLRDGREFNMKDICDKCGLSFDRTGDTQRVYAIILNWRKAALDIFRDPATAHSIDYYETAEEGWDAFMDMLNGKNIFLLFSERSDDSESKYYKKSVYFQPDWVEKEMLDFFRIKKQLCDQITVLYEMNLYGGDFPETKGILVSPKQMAIGIKNNLDTAQFNMENAIENKIKELTTPED